MADSGIIFGDPTTGVGFGNPDLDPQIGLGIPAPATPMNSRLVCPTHIDCPGTDFPVTNYSSENLESFSQPFAREDCVDGYCCDSSYHFACGLTEDDAADALRRELFLCDPCPKPSFEPTYCATAACPDGTGTVTRCSNISQDDAQALANAAAQEPTCGQGIIPQPPPPCNDAQTCTQLCQDGSSFTFTIAPCTIYANSVAEANAIAYGLACQRAVKYRICLSDLPRCTCVGATYSGVISPTITPGGPLSFTLIGSLPPGLAITAIGNTTLTIAGTPTTAGTYAFEILASSGGGGSLLKTFTITVLQITTTTLTDYAVGVAYSVQLAATGGSGSYAWKIVSGSLPSGLSMSLTGLISGTPTAADAVSPLVFDVIDQQCEALDRSFFPPRITLAGVSQTKIKTFRGYPEYQGATGDLYRRIDWSGQIGQQARTVPQVFNGFADLPLGGAYWVYSGASEIDLFGNFISHHEKNRFQPCNTTLFAVSGGIPPFSSNVFHGYCFNGDPLCNPSCQPCDYTPADWAFFQNDASDSQFDFPQMIVGNVTFTPTTLSATPFSLLSILGNPGGPAPTFPKAVIGSQIATWTNISGIPSLPNLVTATLSEPYTNADAEASAVLVNGQGLTAENRPNSRTYSISFITNRESRTTNVSYTLHCTNLIVGQSYDAKITLWDSDGTMTTFTTTFSATTTTFDIAGVIPLPAANHTITAMHPQIAFTP